jgi:hypothetical protein
MERPLAYRDTRSVLICTMVLLTLPAQASAEVAPGKHVDRSLFPKAYGILANENLMYPIDMADWPVRIDSSRQLLIDDYLIAATDNVTREVHQAAKHPANPLIVPEHPWERTPAREGCLGHLIRRDEKTGRFRMWYAGYAYITLPSGVRARFPGCYAESEDGLKWTKPQLGLHAFEDSKANNIIIPAGNLVGVIEEPNDPDPSRRYKGIVWHEPTFVPREGYYLYTSPDGIHWNRAREQPLALSVTGTQAGIGDTSLFRWDRALGKYVCDAKILFRSPTFRCRGMMESDDLIHWTPPRMTIYPDSLDDPDAQIYGHMSFCYESMWVGFMRVMHTRSVSYKQTTVELTASRDGRHWTRVGRREEFVPLGKQEDWDAHYHDPSTEPILVGDELWIYYRSTRSGKAEDKQTHCIGLAKLRRDGFVSLNGSEPSGTVMTRPLTMSGRSLFINAEVADGGYVKAAVLSPDRKPLESYSLDESVPVSSSTICGPVTWNKANRLVCADGDHIRLVFQLSRAKLYSFWFE